MLPAPALAEPGADPHPRALPGEEVGHALSVRPFSAEVGVEVEVVRLLLQEHGQVVRAERSGVCPPWLPTRPLALAQEVGYQPVALGIDLVRAEVGAQGEAPGLVTYPAHGSASLLHPARSRSLRALDFGGGPN